LLSKPFWIVVASWKKQSEDKFPIVPIQNSAGSMTLKSSLFLVDLETSRRRPVNRGAKPP